MIILLLDNSGLKLIFREQSGIADALAKLCARFVVSILVYLKDLPTIAHKFIFLYGIGIPTFRPTCS